MDLDDRFHEGCQKGGIHLRLEAPIYGPVDLGQGVETPWPRGGERSSCRSEMRTQQT